MYVDPKSLALNRAGRHRGMMEDQLMDSYLPHSLSCKSFTAASRQCHGDFYLLLHLVTGVTMKLPAEWHNYYNGFNASNSSKDVGHWVTFR